MKVRRLVFDGTDESSREDFTLLYNGFLAGGPATSRGMEVIRREVHVLDKLEGVSEEVGGARVLRGEPNLTVALDQPEFELLKRYFEATPWTTRAARKVVAVSDWLSSIPLEE